MRTKKYNLKIAILISFLIVIGTINQIEIANGKNNILQLQIWKPYNKSMGQSGLGIWDLRDS